MGAATSDWFVASSGNHATALLLLRATLPCETALWLFHDVDRRRKLKGWAKTWTSHHQIPRQDGDQAERCDGNLPLASRLMALLSMTVIVALRHRDITNAVGHCRGGFFRCRGGRGPWRRRVDICRVWDPVPPRWKLKCDDWLSGLLLGPVAARRIRHVQLVADLGQTVPGDSSASRIIGLSQTILYRSSRVTRRACKGAGISTVVRS